MKNYSKKLVLSIAVALATTSLVQAEGFYVTAQVGISEQSTDSKPTGNNLAVDPTFPDNFESGDGTVAGIGIGYAFNDNIRVEGRISNRDGSFDQSKMGAGDRADQAFALVGEIESTTYSVEAFYDFTNSSIFTPYVKAGVGISDNSYSAKLGGSGVAGFFDSIDGTSDGFYTGYTDGDSTEFSWNVGIGGNIEISKSTSIFLEYQYVTFGDVESGQDSLDFGGGETNDGFGIDGADANEFIVGINVKF